MNDEVNRVNFAEIQQSIDAVYYETSNLKKYDSMSKNS